MNRVNYNGARATDSTDFGLIGMEQTDPSDRGTAIDHIGMEAETVSSLTEELGNLIFSTIPT